MSSGDPKKYPTYAEDASIDLQTMKRLFGEPVLLGREKMREFDEYAESILKDHAPGDVLMASLTWEFILVSYTRMRLMRYQSRAVQGHILEQRRNPEATPISDREDEASASLQAKINTYEKFEYLISGSSRRETALLNQITLYRVALAQKRSRELDAEERQIELEERKRREQKERELDEILQRREEQKSAAGEHRTGPRHRE